MFGWLSLLSLTECLEIVELLELFCAVADGAGLRNHSTAKYGRTGSGPGDTQSPPNLQSGHGSRHIIGECCSCRARRYLYPAMRRPLGTHSHVHGATTYSYLPISNAALMIAEQP